ncbi:MAG: MOSC domain-containing protein [Blastocatellia bacterium]|jgi:MOSC domain-containing protein YiiM
MPKVCSIHSGDQKGGGKPAILFGELVTDSGLRGDRHAGRDPLRQVSLFSEEVRRGLEQQGYVVPPESLSANIFTLDLPLDELPPGTLLRIGEAELELTEKRAPCRSITRIDYHLPKLLASRCGQLARVRRGGIVSPGDPIEVLPLD